MNLSAKGDAFPDDDIDLLVLPGSKSTIADLLELRENGWERPIKSFAEQSGHSSSVSAAVIKC